ncbi:MAG: peptidase P60, partial [Alphaproteobacteria bacterium]
MSETRLDRRIHAYREDLAAESLKGAVDAPAYARGQLRQVMDAAAALRRAPRHDAPLDTELLCGERVTVYDENEGWAWVQSERDGYVGYLSSGSLVAPSAEPTHRVSALRTYRYPAPDMKLPPLGLLHLNSRVTLTGRQGRFAQLADGSFVIESHLAGIATAEPDFVAVAERFLAAPYLWGGRTSIGLDCSALVQLALQAAGVPCPRDSDMQEQALGEPLPGPLEEAALRRGDLIFWSGHVGIMRDAETLLHANA